MITDKFIVTFRGKKVHNPVLKALLIPYILTTAIIPLPVTIPLHLVLRKMNRNGFLIEKNGNLEWMVEVEGFKKRQ